MAAAQNWLNAANPIPDDALIASHYKSSAKTNAGSAPCTSSVEAYREDILAWHQQDIPVTAMRQALVRK